MLEPKTRNVEPEMLMEQLFRLTELEMRVPLNLNVLDPAGVPRVMSLKEALQAFLDHRREVLQRRSRHRLAAVARRIEILKGQIIVYLNLDEVIRIIREADEPKAEMMARWDLSEVQAEAILEHAAARLAPARRDRDPEGDRRAVGRSRRGWRACWRASAGNGGRSPRRSRETGAEFGGDTALGRRRTAIAEAPATGRDPGRGVDRARAGDGAVLGKRAGCARSRGTASSAAEQKYKEGDGPRFAVAGRDHRPADRVRDQWPLLHDRASTGCPAGAARASRCG